MKKAMKLVWMVLLALPVISLTSCEDDNESAPFQEYGYLIDKTREDVIKDLPFNISAEEPGILKYANINSDNVSNLTVFFTFDNYDDKGALITYDKCVAVYETVSGLPWQTVVNHLSNQYGKSEYIPDYDEEGNVDPDYTYYQYEKGGKYIRLYEDFTVAYIKKSEWDKAEGKSKAGGENLDRIFRAKLLELNK